MLSPFRYIEKYHARRFIQAVEVGKPLFCHKFLSCADMFVFVSFHHTPVLKNEMHT